jgi:uncharacterized protein (DUF1800 family)
MISSNDQQVLHLLNRSAFGPAPGDIDRVRQVGLKAYLEEQLHPLQIDDSAVEERLRQLPTLTMNSEELIENYPPPRKFLKAEGGRPGPQNAGAPQGPVQANSMEGRPRQESPPQLEAERLARITGPQRVLVELAREEIWRAVYSRRQLQEVMVQFWMNHFNIFAGKGADKWLLTSFERDAIRPHALGKFEDLLVATAQSPAMLFYLDNWRSSAPPVSYVETLEGRKIPDVGEEYERQAIMRPPIFGGPFRRELWLRRSRRQLAAKKNLGGGLNENYGRELMELHTLGVNGGYTQQDVIEVARCLTGWTIRRPRQQAEFYFNPRMHDYNPKIVLGHKFPPGRGMEDGLEVLHLLAHHPSTARFISTQLCRRFVADDPPQSVVERASKAFQSSGGEIREVVAAILTSAEFNSPAVYRAKVKSPLEFIASSMRAVGADTDAGLPVIGALARMGHPMFQYEAPSGYADRASTWINSSTLLWRLNFAMLLATNRIPGTEVRLDSLLNVNGSRSREDQVNMIAEQLLGEPASPETVEAILSKGSVEPKFKNVGFRGDSSHREVSTIAGLLLASPQFQRR